MRKAFFFVVLTAIALSARAQVPGAADSVKAQALRMVKAYTAGDYNTFIHYMNPKIVEMAGGVDGFKKILAQSSRQMSTAGISVDGVTLDSMTTILKAAGTLQTTIQQHSNFKIPDGHALATTTLIGMSSDNGMHWKFIDTHGKTNDEMRKVLPNLSPALTIPPPQAPVHSDH